jgi:hypothetical protein
VTLEPLQNWVIGRIAITKASDTIVVADVNSRVTKFIFIEAVSPEAEAKGFKPGQLVMPKAMSNIFLKGGTDHHVTCPVDDLICRVRDVPLEEFVGTDGKPFKSSVKAAA